MLAVLAGACGLSCGTDAANRTMSKQPTPHVPKSTVINTETLADELESLVPQMLEDTAVPGAAIAIIRRGRVVYQRGFGYANKATKKIVEGTTGFNIGSISKTVTAWGVMKLVEDGKLDLDAPVSQYLTRWKLPESEYNADEVTVRRLLSHTAGLSLHGYPGFSPEDELPSIEESLSGTTNGAGAVQLVMAPGTNWQYSGGGYTMAQLLIEEVSGTTFSNYMRDTVLRPLGMENSDFEMTSEILANSATCYDGLGNVTPSPRFTAMAAAGLHTTIADFALFAAAAVQDTTKKPRQTVLRPESISLMLAAAPVSGGKYGLGYMIEPLPNGSKSSGHGGANRGWHAYFAIVPETGDGLVVTTNGDNGGAVHTEIRCAWTKWLTGELPTGIPCKNQPPPKERHEVEVKADLLEEYVGVYQLSPSFHLNITLEDGALQSQATNQPMVPIFPESATEFFLKVVDAQVTFVRGESGKIEKLILHQNRAHKPATRLEGQDAAAAIESVVGKPRTEVKVSTEILAEYVGRYELAPSFHVTISLRDDKLFLQATNQPIEPIFAESETDFFSKTVNAQISFVRGESGTVTGLVIHQGGTDHTAKKVK